ncbi:peptide-methionine (R)-S-oxide reductase [bacterium]|nr:peptide-methionine (R)-S-oxide reductase [bacterium]
MHDDEWKLILTPEQYAVLRQCGTEPAFQNKYWDNHADGSYRCAACGTMLFSSDTKFDSGTGWPSFSEVASNDAIELVDDNAYGMRRTEVRCKTCGGHLGHLFMDGPSKSGKRFCINSASLDFEPKDG